MPEMLALVACEKVLIDEMKNPTLIVLLDRVEVQIPGGHDVPSNVVSPREWAVFALWKLSDEKEKGGHYKQVCEIVPHEAQPSMRLHAEFDFMDNVHRVTHRITGFPIGKPGVLEVRVWLEKQGARATNVYSYPITIAHNREQLSPPRGTDAEKGN